VAAPNKSSPPATRLAAAPTCQPGWVVSIKALLLFSVTQFNVQVKNGNKLIKNSLSPQTTFHEPQLG
jgi:hypothetical protein